MGLLSTDVRSGVSAPDAVAITLVNGQPVSQLYRVQASLFGNTGLSSTGTNYQFKHTDANGNAKTATAVGSLTAPGVLQIPSTTVTIGAGKQVTGQASGPTFTSGTINVTATVEAIG